MNFDWDHAKTFLAVADAGTLSGAARRLGQTQPTVSRQIAAFEEALSTTLFERTGRSVTLTPFGVALLEHVRGMARAADMVALSAAGQSQSVDGQVRVTASELIATFVLPPIVVELAQQAPHLAVDIVADNEIKDLARRQADIAIRHARPDQPNLIAKRVSDIQMQFCASAHYLDTAGHPTKNAMHAHQIVSYAEADAMLGYLNPTGLALTQANFRYTASSQVVALEMVRNGLGIAILPSNILPKLPDVVPIKTDLEEFALPTWLVTHAELKTSRRIRFVFDALSNTLA